MEKLTLFFYKNIFYFNYRPTTFTILYKEIYFF